MVAVRINPSTGLLAQANQDNAIIEYFRKEDVPSAEEDSTSTLNAQGEESQEEHLF
ncbi:hypothetical protein Loa_01149 [Legionella oakridgensis ATCC 33761 = DSM 21215]|uniref:Uncharacterized protein n=1 Tax=Legionella oakridgensis ATCC 33761 = DSM 21215 TaxID=1268635 RepID=W0BA18_9GAMM|nr:hypothetical protein [Legionella oakridgensis]AHE66705.1 hypothetical protein Loa_01149 [Legionella oakridgensis ATCC 33761 = DSM 21215]